MVHESIQYFSFSVKLTSLRIVTESPSVLCEKTELPSFYNECIYVYICFIHIHYIYIYICIFNICLLSTFSLSIYPLLET